MFFGKKYLMLTKAAFIWSKTVKSVKNDYIKKNVFFFIFNIISVLQTHVLSY